MKRALLSLLALALMVSFAAADSVTDFLKVRRTNKLSSIVGTDALNTLVGSKIFEIRARVKGVVKVGDRSALILDGTDHSSPSISATKLPEWLDGTDLAVRLIVRASRETEYSELVTELIAAVPEDRISPYDPKPTAAPPAKGNAKPSKSTSSSGSGLSGEITSRGTKLNPSRGGYNRPTTGSVAADKAVPIYAQYIKGRNKKLSDAMAQKIAEAVIGFSVQYGVDARLVMAMAIIESGLDPNATSHTGAMGLVQLMPGTASGLGVRNAYDVTENLFGAVKLIRGHLDNYMKQTGDPEQALILALAAYNAGSGAVRKHGGVPPYKETQAYVRKVISVYYQLAGV
jgi:hypothetical protein